MGLQRVRHSLATEQKWTTKPKSWALSLTPLPLCCSHPVIHWSLLLPPCGSAGKESSCNTRDLGSIPGLGRSPGEGKGYPLQYSGLENSMDCIVHGVAKNLTRLSDFHSLSLLISTILNYSGHYSLPPGLLLQSTNWCDRLFFFNSAVYFLLAVYTKTQKY